MVLDTITKNFNKENDRALRNIFKDKIKGSFLIEVKYKVFKALGDELFDLYPLNISNASIATSNYENPSFDICCHIVGNHRFNMTFVEEHKRIEFEKDEDYIKKLVQQVKKNVRLRKYGSEFFRKQPITFGDRFLYFSVPYDLFVLCMRMNELFRNNEKVKNINYKKFYIDIINRSLSALLLLEDNFFDSAYPICRGITELYVKLFLIKDNSKALENYFKLSFYELDKDCCGNEKKDEFNEQFIRRKNKKDNNKINYLHFGWVDNINDFHKIVKNHPYSINGIFEYLLNIFNGEQKISIENIRCMYNMCHGYVHGNISNSRYPLLDYFIITMMLFYPILYCYKMLCEDLDCASDINGINIVEKTEEDAKLLFEQYAKRSTENFEAYYKNK